MLLEVTLLRRLYRRDHLSQVLATFALILICNEVVRMIWGSQPIMLNMPAALSGPGRAAARHFLSGLSAAGHRRSGWRSRCCSTCWWRRRASACGCAPAPPTARWRRRWASTSSALFTLVFAVGAALCAVAGALLGPAAGGAGRHGREHPDPGLRRHRDRRHRLDPRRAGRRAAGRHGRHRRPRAAAAALLRSFLPPAVASDLGPALASIADLRADGRGAVLEAAGACSRRADEPSA